MKYIKILKLLSFSFLIITIIVGCEKSDPEAEDPQQQEDNNTFIDSRDGKKYKYIELGTQIWMAENLAYLPSVNSPSNESSTDPRYYVDAYDGTSVDDAKLTNNYDNYGVLYNWLAATTSCPTGWHLPSDDEWKVLELYLGMSQEEADEIGCLERGSNEGSQLAGGLLLWEAGPLKTDIAFNSSGFEALPGGFYYMGSFSGTGRYGKWWSNTISYSRVIDRALYYNNTHSGRGDGSHKEYGYSVRCIKD